MSETTTISIEELRPGVVLPAAIFDGTNTDLLLIGKGVRITKKNLARLVARGVTTVAFDEKFVDEISGVIQEEEACFTGSTTTDKRHQHQMTKQEKLRGEAEKESSPLIDQRRTKQTGSYDAQQVDKLREKRSSNKTALEGFFEESAMLGLREGKQIHGIAVEAVEDLLHDMDIFVKLAIDPDKESSEEYDDHQHCIRVSELAMAVAAVMRFTRKKIEELGVGCLIYRSAMSNQALAMRKKDRELSNVERLELAKNPVLMFEALKDIAGLPSGARQVAYQIYERWDGSGYPRQRYGNQIHPLSRIASVCDTYVALTSPRPHRPAFEPYQAVETMLEETQKGKYDPQVVKAFLQTVCLYPIGSFVELCDESLAVVVRTNIDFYDNPTVQILFNGYGERIVPETIDLAERPDLSVSKAIEHSIIETMLLATEEDYMSQFASETAIV